MKTNFSLRILLTLGLLGLAGCAPQALYFHEATKVGFAANYNASDSEPVSTTFGYQRRIVAVVPAKERNSATGQQADAENQGESLSTISKFHVTADTKDGMVIKNNFATGMAARKLMKEPAGAAVAVAGLMHNTTVLTDSAGAVVNSPGATETVSDVAASRVARIKSKMVGGPNAAPHDSRFDLISKVLFIRDGQTWVRETYADGHVVERQLKNAGEDKKKAGAGDKTKTETNQPGIGTVTPGPLPLPQDKVNDAPASELLIDPATGQTMKNIKKSDGTTEVVPLKP